MAGPWGRGLFLANRDYFNNQYVQKAVTCGFITTYTNVSASSPLTMESIKKACQILKQNSFMLQRPYTLRELEQILCVDSIQTNEVVNEVRIRVRDILIAKPMSWLLDIRYLIDRDLMDALYRRKSELHEQIEQIHRAEQRRIHEKHARVCVPGQIVRASDGGWDIQACSGSGGVNMAQTEPPKKQEAKVEDPVQDLIAYYYAQNI